METNDLILAELRELRSAFNEYAQETGERLASLETQVKSGITGNGQPSRLQMVEGAIAKLQAWRWYLLGAAAGVSGVVSCVAWIVTTVRR